MQIHDIELLKIIRIDADRCVSHVRVGKLYIKSLWITGISTGRPMVRWPESGKGYPIVEAEPDLKAEVEHLVLAGLESGPPGRRARPRRPATRTACRASTPADPFDDPLEDLFKGATP